MPLPLVCSYTSHSHAQSPDSPYIAGNLPAGLSTPVDESVKASILRIGADGSVTNLGLIPGFRGMPMGDIDDKGQWWIGTYMGTWGQIDLDPKSAAYAKVADQGTEVFEGYINDWCFLPGKPGTLYTINSNGDGAELYTFDTTTHKYTKVRDYGGLVVNKGAKRETWGSLYAINGNTFLGGINQGGDIYNFPLDSSKATKFSAGPPSSGSDGARCINAPEP